VHAIVDSLWVRKKDMTERERQELLEEISNAVGIPIALEGNYRWIAFVPSRMAPNVAVANRYFGLFDTGEMKMRGLEVRRSDSPPLVKKMQAEMLRALASASNSVEFWEKECEVLAILKRYLTDLRSGTVAIEDLVISQKLSKNPAEYKTNTAMAAASRALCAAGMNPQPGERVELIIVDSGARDQAVKAVPYTAATETITAYDADKYAELLVRAAESILLRRLDKAEFAVEQSAGPANVSAINTLDLFQR
jgi:DNA polymerase-2